MKHRTPTAPGRVRRAAVTAIARAGRSTSHGQNDADERRQARHVPRHAHRSAGRPALPWSAPAHAAQPARAAGADADGANPGSDEPGTDGQATGKADTDGQATGKADTDGQATGKADADGPGAGRTWGDEPQTDEVGTDAPEPDLGAGAHEGDGTADRPERERPPRHAAAIDPRLTGVGLGMVAVTATLAAIPVVAAGPNGPSPTQATARRPAPAVATPPPAATPPVNTATPAPPVNKATVRAGSVADGVRRPTPAAAPAKPKPKRAPDWVNPMPSGDITSCFGQRWGVLHAGLDLAAPSGTPVRAAGDGRVVSAGSNYAGYGNSVLIKHGNGYLTHYGHLSRTSVDPGDRVSAGSVIGREGSTGDSTGPHLHFEVHKGLWRQIDPAPWLRARGVRIGC